MPNYILFTCLVLFLFLCIGITQQFVCPEKDGIFANPANSSSYYQCSNGYPNLFHCPGNLVFNPTDSVCEFDNDTPQCQKDGYYVHPTDPHKFYECSNGIVHVFNCPDNLIFNATNNECDFDPRTINLELGVTLSRAKTLATEAQELIKTLESLNRKDEAALIEREIQAITSLTKEIVKQLTNSSIIANEIKLLAESLKIREDVLENELKNLSSIINTTTRTTVAQTTTTKPITITTISVPTTTSTQTTPPLTTSTPTLTTITTQQPLVQIIHNCDEVKRLNICHCYIEQLEESYIICNSSDVDDNALSKLSQKLPNYSFGYLSISRTNLTKITNDTFKYNTFNRIYVEQNNLLEKIETNSFKASLITEFLIIRNNPKLTGDLFGVARNLRDGLVQIVFNNNRISSVPSNGFSYFPNVKLIYVSSQTMPLKTVERNAIHHLPSLTQIVLENNQLNRLDDNAIDVSDITSHNVVIDLNTNQLNESSLTTKTIITNVNTIDVSLNLDNNAIKSVYGNDLFERFAKSDKGIIYMRGNPIDCSCVEIVKQNWLKNGSIQHIWGLSDVVCNADSKTIAQCLV